MAFFIGGAGDKESYYFSGPYGNIDDARAPFDKRIKDTTPDPRADMWITVLADPKDPDQSDAVANCGERWIIKSGPDINATMDINHASARGMFHNPIQNNLSAADHMFNSIDAYING